MAIHRCRDHRIGMTEPGRGLVLRATAVHDDTRGVGTQVLDVQGATTRIEVGQRGIVMEEATPLLRIAAVQRQRPFRRR